MNSTKDAQVTKGKLGRRVRRPGRMGLQTVCRKSMLPLRISDQQPEGSTSSKLWDLNMQVQGSQNSPTSGVVNAKWWT